MFVTLVTILFVIIGYYFVYKPHQYWKNLNVPYIKPWPLFGNMERIFLQIDGFHGWITYLYNAQNTKISGIYLFNVPVLLVRDLNLIKQIGIKQFDHFVDHRHLVSEDIDPLFGKNLFALKGEKWRNMRSTLSPAFTSSKIKSMFVLILECAIQFKEYFLKKVDHNEPLEIELNDVFSRVANDIIATTAFGIQSNSLQDKNNEFYEMGKDATKSNIIQSLKFFLCYISKTLIKLLKIQIFSPQVSEFFRNIVKTTVEVREKEGIVRPDMIHLLMEARKGQLKHKALKDDDAGFATVVESDIGKDSKHNKIELTDDDITAQALLFFFAGFDSIAKLMSFMAYELAQHLEMQEKLQNEIDETLENCKGKLTYETVMKMKYLDMVLSESLRKWPPASNLDRMCTKPFTIEAEDAEGYPIHIRKNDLVWIPTCAFHWDPKYFPDPEKFDPERFSDKNKSKIHPIAYMPFGIGPRNCIASRFALMEAKIIFVNILSMFSFVLTARSEVPLKLKPGNFRLNTVNGIWVGLKRRNAK